MKLTTIIGTAIAAVGLAACSSTVVTTAPLATPTPTVAPTVAPTPTATPAPTPTATPTATPTPTPQPGVTLTATCSNIPEEWPYPQSPRPYPSNGIMGTVTGHNLTIGDYLNLGLPGDRITSSTISVPPFGPDLGFGGGWTQGSWDWSEWTSDQQKERAAGTFTIPACAPSIRATACDHAGTASGGAIAWSEPGYSTLTITGPAPSTYRFTLPVSVGTYGPLTAGTYSDRLNGSGASVSGALTIPDCPG
jgi:hypothetical protein